MSSQGGGGGGGPLSTIQQLRDTQNKLREAEVKIGTLETDNAKMRSILLSQFGPDELQRRMDSVSPHAANAYKGVRNDANSNPLTSNTSVPIGNNGGGALGDDGLLKELKQQIVDLSRRNSELERDLTDQSTVLRRQYEAHIESLELELRRSYSSGRYQTTAAAAQQQQYHQHQPPGRAPSPSARPSEYPSSSRGGGYGEADNFLQSSAGRTPTTRKNLL